MGKALDEQEFWEELSDTGEHDVKLNLAGGRYGGINDTPYRLAMKWLAKREQSRAQAIQDKNDRSTSEQIRVARSAKNAAWTAAIAAIVAAIIAAVAAYIAYSSLK